MHGMVLTEYGLLPGGSLVHPVKDVVVVPPLTNRRDLALVMRCVGLKQRRLSFAIDVVRALTHRFATCCVILTSSLHAMRRN